MTSKRFADYLSRLEKTSSRLSITRILADLLREASPEEIDKVVFLSLGRLAPTFTGIEFNLAEKLMIRVLARATGQKEKIIKVKYKKIGDLGDTAMSFNRQEKGKSLKVTQVYERLYQVAIEEGKGSVEKKIAGMVKLLQDLDKLSVKYIARIPVGKLRLGFSELTILDALSLLVSGDKSKRSEIEKAFNKRADIGQIAKILKTKGLKGLEKITVTLGTSVMPALSQRLPTADEMIKKMGRVAAEPKFDGTRIQIHFSREKQWQQNEKQLGFDFKPKGFVKTFTRNLEDTTGMFPDLVASVFGEVKAREAILDAEAIGFNPKSGKVLPFQETIKRKRKYAIGQASKDIPLRFYCFDVLYKDGQELIRLPFTKRRKILEEMLAPGNKTVVLTPQIVTDDPKVLKSYHEEQIEKGFEGLMVKKIDSIYEPGRRGFHWVKFKQEETKKGAGLADTLDCVVMGYYSGRGKRASFGIGGFLVGVRDEKKDLFVTVSKIGTGLTDEQWRNLRKRINKVKVKEKPKEYLVNKNLFADVWCTPEIVVETKADNITRSPIHTAKLALRFPRLVRFRDDKLPSEATTLAEVEKLYQLQG